MELSKIQIINFRSIKEASIVFENNCLILLGKNEAGKSNILKAVAAVFGEYEVTDKDRRKRLNNEIIDDYYVRAFLKVTANEFKRAETAFKNTFKNTDIIVFNNEHSIQDYMRIMFNEILIHIDIKKNSSPVYKYWASKKSDYELTTPLFIDGGDTLTTVKTDKPFDIQAELFKILKSIYLESAYTCHYWQYSKDYLLPSTVNIAEFIKMPTSIQALENIFNLCNRTDITTEFERAKSEDGDYVNLLEQVSKQTTKVFQKIWSDFKDTSIELTPDGEKILIKVTDKAKYSFEDRSDGFKKIISILLMLSTKSRTQAIHDKDLILIDEPDQSLYPSSARDLRDELLRISKNSKIIYSTHSQYMIDSDDIEKHIIVEKKGDITTLTKQKTDAPFSQDELLLRAIGSSIFECIQPVNIIFEGYLDKQVFDTYVALNKRDAEFKIYGKVFLHGISGVESLVQLLILANKRFVIVADSDPVSTSKKDNFIKGYPEHKDCWLGYADICPAIKTLEDFYSQNYISKTIDQMSINSDWVYENSKSAIDNITSLTENDKEKTQEIKKQLANNLGKDDLKTNYDSFLQELISKLQKLKE